MGAWDFGRYRYIKGDRMGTKGAVVTTDTTRVNRAIASFQKRLKAQGFDPRRTDGVFGYWTDHAVKAFQRDHDLTVDGQIGRFTSEELLRQKLSQRTAYYESPPWVLPGIIAQESGFDPAAIGSIHPADHGLVQINTETYPVDDRLTFDAMYSIEWAGERMRLARDQFFIATGFASLGDDDLCWRCAAAHHHAPASAREWARTGTPPDASIEAYVQKVMEHGIAYWQATA